MKKVAICSHLTVAPGEVKASQIIILKRTYDTLGGPFYAKLTKQHGIPGDKYEWSHLNNSTDYHNDAYSIEEAITQALSYGSADSEVFVFDTLKEFAEWLSKETSK
jgi:hypothetical protein